jgi:hypothetical protein
MPIGFLTGLGSGLASALLFYSAARGSPLLSPILLLLTPLPTLIAGLGWGWLPAAVGGVAGSLMMAGIASLPFALGYFMALGAPSALLAYLAYLSRPAPADPSRLEWYPAGRLMAALSLYAGALPIAVLPLIGGSYDVLHAPMSDYLHRLSQRAAPEIPFPPLTDDQIAQVADFLIAVLPAVFAGYWLMIFSVNLYLAGRIAKASARLGRDWPDLPSLTYPAGLSLVAVAAFAASFAPAPLGVAGISFSGAMLVAYLTAGLAVVHFIARIRARWLLWLVYGALFVLGPLAPYVALMLVFAGLLEPIVDLRRRFGTVPPST